MNGSIAPPLPGVDDENSMAGLSVTSLASRSDGLSYAVGTSTGHTLLYDIRSPRAYAIKDLGYGLPVKNVTWIEGGSRMAGDGLVLSADKKVIKIWDKTNVRILPCPHAPRLTWLFLARRKLCVNYACLRH